MKTIIVSSEKCKKHVNIIEEESDSEHMDLEISVLKLTGSVRIPKILAIGVASQFLNAD